MKLLSMLLLLVMPFNALEQKELSPKVVNNTENITVNIEAHQTGTIEQIEEPDKSCCRTPTKVKYILIALGGTTMISLAGVLALFVELSKCKE